MTVLRDFSVLWSLCHTLVLFILLFESRYPKRKTMIITLSTMIPLIAANMVLMYVVPHDVFGTLMLATISLPSLVVFWILAKNRDGRFLFTFCLVDTTVLEIIYITQILNHYTTPDTYYVMFFIRLIIYPVLEVIVYKKLRPLFLEVQKNNKKGWGTFALIGALFYVTITLMMNRPTSILERPEYLPAVILMFILMPAMYLHILTTLNRQKMMLEMTERDSILQLQVSNITARVQEYSAANNKFRIERHNFRHKMQTIAGLVERKQYDALQALVLEYNAAIKETQVKSYCRFAVLDAVLSSYLQKAETAKINVSIIPEFPEELPVNEAELAAVVANALENAINACKKLPESERFIRVHVISSPCFMMKIQNSFDGQVDFDEEGIPVNPDEEHGFGTRSIAAFCAKHDAFCEFKTDENVFTLNLVFGK